MTRRVGQAQLAITAAARGGVLSLTRTLAREFGRAGITVNALAFGWVETGHIDPDFWQANREKILQSYAIKRLGRPGDIAPAVAFLASDLAAWITGQTSISGGYTTNLSRSPPTCSGTEITGALSRCASR